MAAHAKKSPSASGTWMKCSAAIPFADAIGAKGTESSYAATGTAIHEVAEKCFTKGFVPDDFLGKEVYGIVMEEDHIETAQTFVDFVNNIPGAGMYEQRVNVEVIENCWGTADVIKSHNTHMNVVDLKTGYGVKVDAKENKQGLCYSLGAFNSIGDLFGIETVTFTIVQPPLGHIDSYTFDVERLEEFKQELIEADKRIDNAREIIEEHGPDNLPDEVVDEIFAPSEKVCKFCRAKPFCPAQWALATRAARADFGSLTKPEIIEFAELAPVIKDFLKAIEAEVKKDLLADKPVDGFKLVEGTRQRVWKDEERLIKKLKKQYPDRSKDFWMSEPELLSVAQLEKVMKKEPFDLNFHVKREDGKPTVVPEDDPRQPYDKHAEAVKDFSE